jgi:hypothetical protein
MPFWVYCKQGSIVLLLVDGAKYVYPDLHVIFRDTRPFFGGSLDENVKALTKGADKAACAFTNAYAQQLEPQSTRRSSHHWTLSSKRPLIPAAPNYPVFDASRRVAAWTSTPFRKAPT